MTSSATTATFNPLDQPSATLANHAEPGHHAESSKAAQTRGLSLHPGAAQHDWANGGPSELSLRVGAGRSLPAFVPDRGTASPARVNPYHLLVHPNNDEALPPLPAHIEKLIYENDEAEQPAVSGLAHGNQPDHAASKEANHVMNGAGESEMTATHLNGFYTRTSLGSTTEYHNTVKSTRNGTSPRSLQEPPPSPPISEIAYDGEGDRHEAMMVPTHVDESAYRGLAPPLILSTSLTSEPAEVESIQSRPGSRTSVRPSREHPITAPLTVDTVQTSTSEPFPRISRRVTNPTPASPQTLARSPLVHSQSTYGSPVRPQTSVPGVDGAALDSDILAQAETIRRERLERRQKKETAEIGADQGNRQDSAKVLVGNLIGEDHVNYVLMYNMLTGIRIGVSRCQAKLRRPLTDEDYHARHKYSFDIVGNELTPSAKYDFKFKDYAPWVFRDLREEHFHLDPADYLLSLTAKYILSELGSPGKSGSFFYFSRDYRFIIKTISHSEHKFLRSILKQYHEHVKSNPHTLLSRFYGLHRVKLPRGRKIHFVIMNNLFPPHRDIHETYDLKGSAFGREYPEEKAKQNPKAVLKDKNWVNRGRVLELGPEKRALLSEQLRRDMQFLRAAKVMDYSLLVGIHNMARGNRDNLRENQLSVFNPDVHMRRKPSAAKPASEASNVRKAVRRSDPKMLDAAHQLPNADSADRRHFLFYQDEGGMRATDESNQNLDMIYYLGVIDICTPYNNAKRLEHMWKSMTEDRQTISCIDPASYGQRFLNFLLSVMRGGDLSLRPAGLMPQDGHLKTE